MARTSATTSRSRSTARTDRSNGQSQRAEATAKLSLEQLVRQIKAGEVDTVIIAIVDLQGRLMGKRLTGPYFLDHVDEGLHACDYLLAMDVDNEPLPGFKFTNWGTGYGDMHGHPDLSTIRRLPWLEKTALILCDVETMDGRAVAVSPRQVLRRQVDRARKLGFNPRTASELEFYLFKDTYEGAAGKNYRDLEPYGRYIEDYHILQGSKAEWFNRQIRNGMEQAAVPVENSKGEWGFGQQEINLRYTDALEMADRHVVYKNGVKEIAALNQVAVTFMAKWSMEQAGSSFHLHSSLWDVRSDKALFHANGGEPHGMSVLFKQYLAGQIALARDFAYFYAPYVNSYKRYQATSFAPTSVVWAYDNRTCGFRIVGHGPSLRVECRIPGADANPYIAFAATIAAGLHGIENKLELPPEYKGDAYTNQDLPRVPSNLTEALAMLERSAVARAAFGDEVVEHYLHSGRLELGRFNAVVTDWELRRNFERI
ncbi:MAG: glutamine synthetase family protein [Candidatus Dormibacteraeota bacterium]|nr:glutamine synthetase family protein [Candidatus Dormibacteraeota bacterium]